MPPPYTSEEIHKFVHEFALQHVSNSLKYPQSNGAAEHAVQTIKSLLKKENDPYIALFAYREWSIARRAVDGKEVEIYCPNFTKSFTARVARCNTDLVERN